jgi:hypothetical protein
MFFEAIGKEPAKGAILWFVEVHYWYNSATGEADQVKLKNTVEQGCAGEQVSPA